jgi:hypothetical protein
MDSESSRQMTTRVDRTANERRDVAQVPDADLRRLADCYRRLSDRRGVHVDAHHPDLVARHAASVANAEASFQRRYLLLMTNHREALVAFLAEHPEIRVTDSAE